MKNLTKIVLPVGFLMALFSGVVTAAIYALIVHYLWPYSIPVIKPSWVVSGTIPATISWLSAFATFEVISIFRYFVVGK